MAQASDSNGVTAATTAPGPLSFSSQAPTGSVQSHPSLDSEAMVDAALMNTLHDVEGDLPSLPLPSLSDLTAGRTHANVHSQLHPHSQAATHPALDIFDTF